MQEPVWVIKGPLHNLPLRGLSKYGKDYLEVNIPGRTTQQTRTENYQIKGTTNETSLDCGSQRAPEIAP